MLSELECGICYRTYDSGRRCPRQLPCKHSFCESCLQTLTAGQPDDPQAGSRIICAFCRNITSLSKESVKDSFPVDEDILERLVAAGALEESSSDDEDEEESSTESSSRCNEEPSPTTRRGKMWRSVKRFWKKVRGSNQQGCITDDDIVDLALMACLMI